MKTKKATVNQYFLYVTLILALAFLTNQTYAYQGGPGTGNDSNQQVSPASNSYENETDEMVQARDQERINAPEATPQIEQRTQQQGQDQDNTNRKSEQIQARIHTSEELEEFIQKRTLEQTQNQEEGSGSTKSQGRVIVATEAMMSAQEILGIRGPLMSKIAEEVNQATKGMATREESIEKHGWLRTFFFGQDHEQASALKNEAEENRARVQEMNQLLTDCKECDEQIRTTLGDQLQILLDEQDRLDQVANEALNRKGILGWLFGN